MREVTKVRIDKWLWCVRLFKTRSLATDAVNGGIVKLNDEIVKAGRAIKVNEIVTYRRGPMTRTIKVKALLDKRVGAPLVENYIDDLTPKAEYEEAKLQRMANQGVRDRGDGRPTKKDRRSLDKWGEWD